ncbi:MAG TPA: alanine racemase, partial [Candidatus Limiplasma sp.]|nr:alanine racemase [Candidatus Limiplasma sp.]
SDLEAMRYNYRLMADYRPKPTRVMAVVKANAYGHGILEVAKTVTDAGCTDLAVAIPEEGIALRESGLMDVNILVMGAVNERSIEPCIQNGLAMTVFDPETVLAIQSQAEHMGKTAHIHIKLDTGMGRIGLRTLDEAMELAETLQKTTNVHADGIYTHFADADHVSDCGGLCAYSQSQLSLFNDLRACFDPSIPVHASNSAMSLVSPDANFSMVREGISLYGYPPVTTELPFRHAMQWEAEIVHIKQIEAGCSIGYGCSFTSQSPMTIATIAVGYGDGYHRSAGNRGEVLLKGKRARIVGRVCMDQIMVDVTHIPDVKKGDIAVLIGSQLNGFIGADELAEWNSTISYEVLLSITTRVAREYSPAQ